MDVHVSSFHSIKYQQVTGLRETLLSSKVNTHFLLYFLNQIISYKITFIFQIEMMAIKILMLCLVAFMTFNLVRTS